MNKKTARILVAYQESISDLGCTIVCFSCKIKSMNNAHPFKVQIFLEGNKNLKKSPTLFWYYRVSLKIKCDIFFQILRPSQKTSTLIERALTNGQLGSKANFLVLIWTKTEWNYFLISALASKKSSDQKNADTLYR